MSFTLTTDELKVASCGSIDFTKFTDPTKDYQNVEHNAFQYWAFIAQDVLDEGFTEEEAKSIIDSLVTKKVLLDSSSTLDSRKNVNKEDYGSWVTDSWAKTATIDGKWMFFLSPEFINDRASS
tara:strand:+ start:59 stop:427 length:369 start_codon:yes stop_codon:yes gene_type:complete